MDLTPYFSDFPELPKLGKTPSKMKKIKICCKKTLANQDKLIDSELPVTPFVAFFSTVATASLDGNDYMNMQNVICSNWLNWIEWKSHLWEIHTFYSLMVTCMYKCAVLCHDHNVSHWPWHFIAETFRLTLSKIARCIVTILYNKSEVFI